MALLSDKKHADARLRQCLESVRAEWRQSAEKANHSSSSSNNNNNSRGPGRSALQRDGPPRRAGRVSRRGGGHSHAGASDTSDRHEQDVLTSTVDLLAVPYFPGHGYPRVGEQDASRLTDFSEQDLETRTFHAYSALRGPSVRDARLPEHKCEPPAAQPQPKKKKKRRRKPPASPPTVVADHSGLPTPQPSISPRSSASFSYDLPESNVKDTGAQTGDAQADSDYGVVDARPMLWHSTSSASFEYEVLDAGTRAASQRGHIGFTEAGVGGSGSLRSCSRDQPQHEEPVQYVVIERSQPSAVPMAESPTSPRLEAVQHSSTMPEDVDVSATGGPGGPTFRLARESDRCEVGLQTEPRQEEGGRRTQTQTQLQARPQLHAHGTPAMPTATADQNPGPTHANHSHEQPSAHTSGLPKRGAAQDASARGRTGAAPRHVQALLSGPSHTRATLGIVDRAPVMEFQGQGNLLDVPPPDATFAAFRPDTSNDHLMPTPPLSEVKQLPHRLPFSRIIREQEQKREVALEPEPAPAPSPEPHVRVSEQEHVPSPTPTPEVQQPNERVVVREVVETRAATPPPAAMETAVAAESPPPPPPPASPPEEDVLHDLPVPAVLVPGPRQPRRHGVDLLSLIGVPECSYEENSSVSETSTALEPGGSDAGSSADGHLLQDALKDAFNAFTEQHQTTTGRHEAIPYPDDAPVGGARLLRPSRTGRWLGLDVSVSEGSGSSVTSAESTGLSVTSSSSPLS